MERVDYQSVLVQQILTSLDNRTLNTTPWYQRRAVWTKPQQSYLINSLHELKPVPAIYLRYIIDLEKEKTMEEVVDGQQRIRAILGYRDNEFPARHPNHSRKVYYSKLNRTEKNQFLTTALSVGYLIGANDQDVVEIFGRINSVAKTINPQERRNARFSGEFKQLCLRQAAERLPFWRSTKTFTANEIARMQEVQFISDVIINFMEGLTDFSAKKIDDYYSKFDENFPRSGKIELWLERLFSKLVEIPADKFADTIFSVPQILFSLMIAIGVKSGRMVGAEKLGSAMSEIDARITAYKDLAILNDVQASELQAFTGGNLHRIKARKERHGIIIKSLR